MKRSSRSSTHAQPLIAAGLALALLLGMLATGCTPDEGPGADTASALPLAEVVNSIVSDHGTVVEVHEGSGTPIVVFQEMHNSALQQAQIAAMLNVLYEDFGLRTIGLEGACKERPSEYTVSGGSYEPSRPLNEREIVYVQLLANGEISAPEMMAAIYSDIRIEPVESTRLYGQIDGIDDSGTSIFYLSLAALTYLPEDEVARIVELELDEMVAALRDAIDQVPETSEIMAAFEGRCTCDPAHLEMVIDLAVERGVATRDELEAEFAGRRRFFDNACERGMHMAAQMRRAAREAADRGERIVAVASGAAHCEIPEELARANHAHIVVRPAAYGLDDDSTPLGSDDWDRAVAGLTVTKSETLRRVLEGVDRKNRPVIGEPWLKAEADIHFMVSSVTRAAAEGRIPPLTQQTIAEAGIPDSEYVNIVPGSLTVDAGEVVFALTYTDQNLHTATMWVRAVVDRAGVEQTLDERLEELIRDLADGTERGRVDNVLPEVTSVAVSSTVKAAFCASEEVAKSFRYQD